MRERIRNRPVLWLVVTGLVALFIGIGIGAATEVEEEDTTELEADLADAEDALADAEDAREQAQARLGELRREVRRQRAGLAEREEELEARAAEVEEEEERAARQTISDGTWQVGEDIEPGTYRSPAGGSCYWERLRSPGGEGIDNIIANGLEANPTVQLEAGEWFRAQDCDEWEKIG